MEESRRRGNSEDLIFVRMNRKVHNARLINRGRGLVMKQSKLRYRFMFAIDNNNAA